MKLVTRLTGLLTALPVMAACALVGAPAPCFGQGARESWQPPDRILDAIGVKPGMRVGEAGAGHGYFTFPLAKRVGPGGVVFANDISTSSLDVIRDRTAREGLRNIEIVVGVADDPRFPEKTLDMVVMVYVLHEVERRAPFLKSVRSYLKPGAPLVVIEGNTTGGSAHTPPFMTNRQVSETLAEAGYELDRIETFLPRDTIYIYKVKQTGTAIPELQAKDEQLLLDGARLGEITQHDAMMLDFHVPRLVERLRNSGRIIPDVVSGLIDAAQAAYAEGRHYEAFRLYARAAGLAHGPERVEGFEVAASLGISINRAVFDRGESITLTARPLFSLGHSLVGTYTARSWLESQSGIVSGTERRRTVRSLEPIAFDFPVDTLGDGIVAVGYRLESLSGETLAEFRYAVVVARDASLRLERLESALATLESGDAGASRTSSRVAALETLRHHTRALEAERLRFDGPWQRRAHPFGMYWSTVNSRATGRTAMEFPQFAGPIRFPEDVALAESLAIALVGGTAALHPSGDTQQAYLAADGELVRYRLFVPAGYDPGRTYPLIVAIHSGAGPGTYFDWVANESGRADSLMKRLAEERGYIVACPSGRSGAFGDFLSKLGEDDVLAVVQRVQSVYSVDPGRIFLTGWSVGGDATWRIGLKHAGLFRAIAPVEGSVPRLNRDVERDASGLGVHYSVAGRGSAVEEARRAATLAKELLPDFTYAEYPEMDHVGVWSKSLISIFDFFDARAGTSRPSASRATAPEAIR